MANSTILDVSQYARLWRGIWWVQHLSMLLALVVGGTLVGASGVYLANALIRDTMGRQVSTRPSERTARWDNLKPALESTHWSMAADAIDVAGALAMFVCGDGLIVIRSPAAHESDYEAALRVATFLMGREPDQGTSG